MRIVNPAICQFLSSSFSSNIFPEILQSEKKEPFFNNGIDYDPKNRRTQTDIKKLYLYVAPARTLFG